MMVSSDMIDPTQRFPTSVDDQVRQAAAAIRAADADGIKRHTVRLLLPLIGATELDDWPGGTRQMMDAASPLVTNIMKQLGGSTAMIPEIKESVIDNSDGTRALFSFSEIPMDDACAILLPSADSLACLRQYDEQVGPKRNMLVVNPQWRRQSDFSFFGRKSQIQFTEKFEPTYSCTNLMVEGDQIRVLRSYPNDWRVFQMVVVDSNDDGAERINWIEIGTKPFVKASSVAAGGDSLQNFGQPRYKEIEEMIKSQDGYKEKSVVERAASAVKFIKDTL